MALIDRDQPYKGSRFKVHLDEYDVEDFLEVRLPETKTAVNDYRTGADGPYHRKLWGSTHHDDLVLIRGADQNESLLEWRRVVNNGNIEDARVDTIEVVLMGENGESGPRWVFTEAWPREYHPPDLTTDEHKVALEAVVVTFDDYYRDE